MKCPYTQQVMKEPIKNRICQHNYEKAAILEFIARRKAKGNARYGNSTSALFLSDAK